MPNPMVFFSIAARDPDAMKRFFSDLFDWEWTPGGPGIVARIDPHGPEDFDPKGALTQVTPDAAPFISIFIRVDDIDATLAKAQTLGASLVLPKVQQPGGGPHIGIIRTPEGHPIGIVQA